jgi:DNA-binding response OmpR family regulator
MTASILIVDDSLTVRADLVEALSGQGYSLHACSDLAQARAALAKGPVDLIILDVLLPDGDGFEWLREIRATPAGAELPVLILSTEAEVSSRIRGLATGSNDYVGKPYERDYIVARTRELLGHRQAGRPPQAAILIIDDSLTFREHLGQLLGAQGFRVLYAASGEEGLRSVALHRPNVVIVDGVLPGIDGPAVIRQLRLDAALRDTPCILLTGSDDRRSELLALESGADACVLKSEAADMVLARVAAVLRNAPGGGIDRQAESLLGPKKILAVDDSLTYLEELGDILRGEGYDVILARSGEEALEMASAQAIDCILLDRLMPGLGGTETCRRLKASEHLRDIPVIMLTGTEDQASMIEGLSVGADDYVLKSNAIEVLKARVRVQLRRKQSEDQNRRIRAELMSKELEAAEARAARELAQSRAELLAILEQKNNDLAAANATLLENQRQIAEKNRQLEAASHLKSEFLANMSHELRTPLNAIIGFSELLKDGIKGPLTDGQLSYVVEIFNGGLHLLSLINDILDLSKIEAGRMTLDLEPVNVAELLQTSLRIVHEKAVDRQIRLTLHVACNDRQLHADPRKLKQIVYNLLSNAVKFTPGKGEVRISAGIVERAAAHVHAPKDMATRELPLPAGDATHFLEIKVCDTGKGLSADELQQLFEPFLQLGSALSKEHEGTGLGLALVKRLTELHGGSVGVASAPGRGACFTVWIPWRASDAASRQDMPQEMPTATSVASDSPVPAQATASEPASSTARRHVLVIEDDVHAIEIMRIYLTDAGFEVSTATNAADGLHMAADLRPDLITLDLLLPDMNGWSVLERLAADPVLRDIPVMVVSITADEKKGVSLGAAKVIPKPVSRDMLLNAMADLGLVADRRPDAERKALFLAEVWRALGMSKS